MFLIFVTVFLQSLTCSSNSVEILTAKRGGPSRDWLNPSLEMVKSQRARSKIRQWFKRQDREQNISHGRLLLDREMRRLGIDAVGFDKIARGLGFSQVDDLLAAIGCGDRVRASAADGGRPDRSPCGGVSAACQGAPTGRAARGPSAGPTGLPARHGGPCRRRSRSAPAPAAA